MYEWQKDIIDNIKNKELRVMMAGRRVGKSTFSTQALKRLMDDMLNRPVENLILSEGTILGARYYCVEPVGGNWAQMEIWCTDVYGDAGDVWEKAKSNWPDCGRWYMNDRKFWFRDERDRTMFILKWR
jgi:hypothetical protein